jgi:hypothetical protein
LSATGQQYFPLRTNRPPSISQQYFPLGKEISTRFLKKEIYEKKTCPLLLSKKKRDITHIYPAL